MNKLRVIPGGAEAALSWLDFPLRISCRSHTNADELAYVRVSGEFPRKSAQASRRQPAFELWSCILDRPPPVDNVDFAGNRPVKEGLSSLRDAHACFRGLKRPIAEDDNGENWITYVIRPSSYYRFDDQYAGAGECVARRLPVAADLVFLAHARLDLSASTTEAPTLGLLTHWGFAEVSGTEPDLPANFDSRFHARLW